MSDLSQKLLARSKYYHSKNKDKNRFKKKAKYVKSNPNADPSSKDDAEEEKSVEEVESDDDSSRFRRRAIEANSYRYDVPEEIVEEDDLNEIISLQENSHASQFRFLSEQEWDEEQPQGKTNAEISVNYESLGAVIGSLPLFIKLKIEEELLTEDIKNHNAITRTESTSNEFSLSQISKEDKYNQQFSAQRNIVTDKTLEDDQKALESLLNLSKQEPTPTPSKGQEDLEQWLDSVI